MSNTRINGVKITLKGMLANLKSLLTKILMYTKNDLMRPRFNLNLATIGQMSRIPTPGTDPRPAVLHTATLPVTPSGDMFYSY